MKFSRKLTIISITLILGLVVLITMLSPRPVLAKDISVRKTIMHDSIVYDEYGHKTGEKEYKAYRSLNLYYRPVNIKGRLYYKRANTFDFLRVSNIDGVIRRVTHDAYIYRNSSKRTVTQGHRVLVKGQRIITYGSPYKFQNGKYYYRIGGPRRQYVKAVNLSSVIRTNISAKPVAGSKFEETTITVQVPPFRKYEPILTFKVPPFRKYEPILASDKDNVPKIVKKVPNGTKFTVDYLESGEFADVVSATIGVRNTNADIYHIKGTKDWVYADDVKAKKVINNHSYFIMDRSYIRFYQNTDVYNADGTKQDHGGKQIAKQAGNIRVDKLLYIWVPSDQKAELFYHLVGHKMYATGGVNQMIDVGEGYVKASDVRFLPTLSKKLKPSNTPAEAEAAAKASNTAN